METFALYLIKSSVWLTGFSLIYFLFLRNERFFVLNRIYLVSGILVSIVFPLFTWHYTVVLPVTPMVEVSEPQIIGTTVVAEPFPTQTILLYIYLAGAIYLLFRVIRQTAAVLRVIRKSETLPFNSAKLIRTTEYPASFSFFSFVFVNPSTSDTETNEIVNHELEHIRQQHWIDLLLFEILCTIQWFNPVSWLYGRFIRQNHEYLADERALQRSSNPAVYRAALLNQMFGGPVIQLANSFNYSLNKKRFNMMKQIIHSPIRKFKLLLIVPLIAGVFYAFAAPEYKFVKSEDPIAINEKTVSGKVISEDGKPLKGASIVVSGKTIGTTTDASGNFKLVLTDHSPIIISYVGFESLKVNPDFDREMTISLKTKVFGIETTGNDLSAIESAKVTEPSLIIIDGKESTKAIMTSINPEKIEKVNILKDKMSIEKYGEKGKDGVIEVSLKSDDINFSTQTLKVQTNSPLKFGNAFGSGAQPLIILDGVITESQNINNIPPETIESISVLKNESATAVYGEKGKNGVILIKTKNPGDVFLIVEEMPSFPGGIEALKTFVATTMKYPAIALENGIIGQVVVNFVVAKDGSVTDAKIASGVDPSLDKEALRIVNSLPKWKPGSQAGEPVRVAYSMPVNFSLPADYHPKSKEQLRTKNTAVPKEIQNDPSIKVNSLIIVPNPTKDKATITLEGSDSKNKMEVSVFDMYGKLITKESKNGPTFTLSFAKFTSGTYFVLAKDGTTQFTGQLVVNH